MRITRVEDRQTLESGAALFDSLPTADATSKFLNAAGHHLLFAVEDGAPVGFITGVEMIHPDKGIEMYLNELGVDEHAQGRGIGTALVQALAAVARENGCYGMWGVTEPENDGAVATYRRSAGTQSEVALFAWEFDDIAGSRG